MLRGPMRAGGSPLAQALPEGGILRARLDVDRLLGGWFDRNAKGVVTGVTIGGSVTATKVK